MKNKTIIITQITFLVIVLAITYMLYPKIEFKVDRDWVEFNSINAKVIMISDSPNFIEPRYLDMQEAENVSFRLKPGTYYWKASNNIITGLKNEFVIDSEVGMKIDKENDSELVNIGNVKLNVTKEGGKMVGHIVLEPDESKDIEDKGRYVGEQAEDV